MSELFIEVAHIVFTVGSPFCLRKNTLGQLHSCLHLQSWSSPLKFLVRNLSFVLANP